MPNDRLPTPERVLVVAAHPDDIEFGAAGTAARWIAEGAEVRYLLMTRGDKGSDNPATDPAALASLREDEQPFRRARGIEKLPRLQVSADRSDHVVVSGHVLVTWSAHSAHAMTCEKWPIMYRIARALVCMRVGKSPPSSIMKAAQPAYSARVARA